LDLLHPKGFILASDYGQTRLEHDAAYEHQRFSQATFIGVNFPELKAYFADGGRCRFLEPPGDSESIHTRLLGHEPAYETRTRFAERFGKPAQDWRQEPVQKARESLRVGRLEAAATHYREALRRQPGSWVLLNEVIFTVVSSVCNARDCMTTLTIRSYSGRSRSALAPSQSQRVERCKKRPCRS